MFLYKQTLQSKGKKKGAGKRMLNGQFESKPKLMLQNLQVLASCFSVIKMY